MVGQRQRLFCTTETDPPSSLKWLLRPVLPSPPMSKAHSLPLLRPLPLDPTIAQAQEILSLQRAHIQLPALPHHSSASLQVHGYRCLLPKCQSLLRSGALPTSLGTCTMGFLPFRVGPRTTQMSTLLGFHSCCKHTMELLLCW